MLYICQKLKHMDILGRCTISLCGLSDSEYTHRVDVSEFEFDDSEFSKYKFIYGNITMSNDSFLVDVSLKLHNESKFVYLSKSFEMFLIDVDVNIGKQKYKLVNVDSSIVILVQQLEDGSYRFSLKGFNVLENIFIVVSKSRVE